MNIFYSYYLFIFVSNNIFSAYIYFVDFFH